ncbi:MAG TPA: 2-hydroxychromene-2-carboxylate isomerase [Ferrovibrio sp.]|uniref:2-hydroxychromene-2-carboxylate isomerase n=1 Tax=Ferrovibrio sp. TaxID=1917215 RepID=UPI002ECFD0EF
MTARRIAFWFDYASPYAYLAASRIAALRDLRLPGAAIDWRPFLLGPIFQRRPQNPGPFQEVAPAERAYRWRDIERSSALYGIAWRRPERYPPNGLRAARLTLVAQDQGWGEACIRAVFRAAFGENRDIADPAVLAAIVDALGRDGADLIERAQHDAVKRRLRDQVEAAMAAGIFGAPTLVLDDGEMFWGNDRLEQAFDWAAKPWFDKCETKE